MQMQPFEKWVINSFSHLYLRWYLMPRFRALVDGTLRGWGLALGPGVGWETFALAEQFPETTLIGVDYDPEQVDRARRNLSRRSTLASRVDFCEGDATKLAFPSESFDFAYALNVLHHIRDYRAALREVHRVLKPWGRFFIQDLSRAFFLPGLRQLFPPESLFTLGDLVTDLGAAGFRVDAARGRAIVFIKAFRR